MVGSTTAASSGFCPACRCRPCYCSAALPIGRAVPLPAPYRCPVCEGRGYVPCGFYGPAPGANPERCRACDGCGLIWR